jgi:hypothetical protein
MKSVNWKVIHIMDKFEKRWDNIDDIDINLCDYKYYYIIDSDLIYVQLLFNNEPIQSRFITKKLMREKKLERITNDRL